MSERDPKTPAEWQDAVDAAEFCLLLDSARQYGLIEGGPVIHADRCAEILKRGKRKGYFPASAEQLLDKFAERVER